MKDDRVYDLLKDIREEWETEEACVFCGKFFPVKYFYGKPINYFEFLERKNKCPTKYMCNICLEKIDDLVDYY